ncbi:MAG TPA: hypothetical protein VL460_12035 [Caulobacteraceae bacterium]|jgi:hypothetical protein|nr:hypothetical protein [Caulobacteraceae bacterium]
MVDASDFLGPDEFADDETAEPPEVDETQDLAALKDCLQALADAIASTNLAVIMGVQGDAAAASGRVQASVGALKRFHDAFAILKAEPGEDEEE